MVSSGLNKMYQPRENGSQIRVYKKSGSRRKSPRLLLKCGDCNQRLEIYFDKDGLEINGVNGSLENWREILLPLLGKKNK